MDFSNFDISVSSKTQDGLTLEFQFDETILIFSLFLLFQKLSKAIAGGEDLDDDVADDPDGKSIYLLSVILFLERSMVDSSYFNFNSLSFSFVQLYLTGVYWSFIQIMEVTQKRRLQNKHQLIMNPTQKTPWATILVLHLMLKLKILES